MQMVWVSHAQDKNSYGEQLFISTDNKLMEMDLTGKILKSINVDYPLSERNSEISRDIVVTDKKVYVYNGTFNPYLSSYEFSSKEWKHLRYPSLSTVNNITFGGISQYQRYLFLTDMVTNEERPLGGIVRFDTVRQSFERSFSDINFIDINVGGDAMYGLTDNSQIVVFNPLTLKLIKKIQLPSGLDFRAIAIDAKGRLLAICYIGELCFFNNGCLTAIQRLPIEHLADIDISPEGTIAIGTTNGEVIISKDAKKYEVYKVSNTVVFTAFGISQPPFAAY